jgi:nucleoid-associated protein YgaU
MLASLARVLLIVVLAGATAAGCGLHAAQRVDEARTAVEAARAAGAPAKAPQEFQAAEQALKESQALLASGDHHSRVEAERLAGVAAIGARSAQEVARLRVDLEKSQAESQAAKQEAARAAADATSAEASARAAIQRAEQARTEAQRASSQAERAENRASEAIRTASMPPPPPPPPPPAPALQRYVVKKGDTLRKIAGRSDVYGDPKAWQRLYEANREIIGRDHRVRPGQVLLVPKP